MFVGEVKWITGVMQTTDHSTLLFVIISLQILTTSGQDVSGVAEILAAQPLPLLLAPRMRSRGVLTITQDGNGITLRGTLVGLPPGEHGFHVHQNGDRRDRCNAAGPHFNPFGNTHGGPNDNERHIGDLGNIVADNRGNAQVSITVRGVNLRGPNSIVGRSLVVHANRDDSGKGGHQDSTTTGNSGARIACGVIGINDPMPPCADMDPNCADRANQCTDFAQEKKLIQRCRRTCGHCDCRDEMNGCAAHAQFCTAPSARHVRRQCRLTCGLCNCKDRATDCATLKDFCNHATYGPPISARCRETCGRC